MGNKAKRIRVDGDPAQNSKEIMAVIQKINPTFFRIPARSPDRIPIEYLFLLSQRISKNMRALDILPRRLWNSLQIEYIVHL